MATEDRIGEQAARDAALEDIPRLLLSSSEETLHSLIENPLFDETHVCLLLERKELSRAVIEAIAKRKQWFGVYRVRLALAAHPHAPRLVAVRALRDLHLGDLVRITLLPSSAGELRRLAEERILVQLPQMPLGQRIMLARRGSARVAAGLILQGPENVARIALDNSFLTEAQLLKTLSKDSLPGRIVGSVAKHEKWSQRENIRVALLRHPNVPSERVAALALDLQRRDIEDLIGLSQLSEAVRVQLQEELARREAQS